MIQGYKGISQYLMTRRWNVQRFVETGGMPSSHAASVAALTTSVGIENGFRSLLFGVTLYFSLIVMYDAAGLRQAAGRQAVILNRLMNEHFAEAEVGMMPRGASVQRPVPFAPRCFRSRRPHSRARRVGRRV
jgi:acid phosphatase family membrane protein YuiD